MKKAFILLLMLVLTLGLCLTSCDKSPDTENAVHSHSYGDWIVNKNATCGGEGEMTRYCACGDKQTEIIAPTGQHTEVVTSAVAPTCTETGLTEGKHCSICGAVTVEQSVVPTIEHTYGEWIITKNPGCGEGEMARYCACGDKQTDVISGTGSHVEITDPAVAPTCTETGLTEGKHCSYCGTVLVPQEVVPKVEHNYSTEYSFDTSFHWFGCIECGIEKDKVEHQVADSGMCTVCDQPIGPTVGIIYDKSGDGTYAEVIGYTGSATKIRIADTYQGLPVKNIYDNAFYQNNNITSVIIPDSVTSIGEWAFAGCYSLSSVVIGDSVTTIGEHAFYYCTSLSSVVIPDSVTSIGDNAFSNCSSLKYNEYENIKHLGSKDNPYFALIEVTTENLSSYTIHQDTKIIADYAFYNCQRLTSISIPDSVTTIGACAFYDCDILSSVVIGDGVTSIGDCAFYGCTSLTDVYYTGSEEEWKQITIDSSNSKLTGAKIYYNYTAE